jgi:hypothetical protein
VSGSVTYKASGVNTQGCTASGDLTVEVPGPSTGTLTVYQDDTYYGFGGLVESVPGGGTVQFIVSYDCPGDDFELQKSVPSWWDSGLHPLDNPYRLEGNRTHFGITYDWLLTRGD